MTQLTPTQRDLYLHHVAHPESTQHLVGDSCDLGANLDSDRWLRAVEQVLSQELLTRTRLFVVDGNVQQLVEGGYPPSERIVIDLAKESHGVTSAEEFIERDRQRPFDLFRLPLWRTYLVRNRDGNYVAALLAPHIFADGWTYQNLFERIGHRYETLLDGSASFAETPVTSSFLDYAGAFREDFESPERTRFWSEKLSAIDPITSSAHPDTSARIREVLSIANPELAEIRRICRLRGWSFVALVCAVYAVLIRRLTGVSGDFVIFDIVDTRPPGFHNVAGCFFQTLPILSKADASRSSITDLIVSMQAQRREAKAQNASSMMLRSLLPSDSLKCFFNFYQFENVNILGKQRSLHTYTGYGEDEMHFVPSITPDGFNLKADYPANRIGDIRFLSRFVQVIRQIVSGCSELAELNVLLPGEPWFVEPIQTKTASQVLSPLLAIAARSREAPDAIAISFSKSQISYGMLEARANRLSHHLAERGAGRGKIVGILLERSPDLIVAILAVLRTGAAYLPLEPSHPPQRLTEILRDSKSSVLVTTSSLADPLGRDSRTVICVDEAQAAIDAHSALPLDMAIANEDAAYVIYTSGSTGAPKGVVITHGNLTALLNGAFRVFNFSLDDVWTMFHSAAFDFSVWEIFGALSSGGRLVIVPHATTQSPEIFYELLQQEGVTVLSQTPSAFLALSAWEERASNQSPLHLRYVVFGGETLRPETLSGWIDRHGDATPTLVNMYGITETTVHVTFRQIGRRDASEARGRSLIGRPLPGWTLTLRDQNGHPVPPGVVGEIYVGGAGVARGYLNRPALDAERFVTARDQPGSRFYRSGDLARVLPDGELEYLGRADSQVKIRGYRIELGEIESALLKQAGIQQAAIVTTEHFGDRRLLAYVVAAAGAVPIERELQRRLAASLPSYMLPWRIITLKALPRTSNGKLDKNALPAPEDRPAEDQDQKEAMTPTESQISMIWSDLLGIRNIAAHDQFFELGGNSLLATQMMFRVRDRFRVSLPLVTAFHYTTIAALAKEVERASVARANVSSNLEAEASPPLRPVGLAPLTFAQERVWFLQQLYPENVAYHFIATLTWNGTLNVDTLSYALTELVSRHEALRTTFESVDGTPRQRVHPPWTVNLDAQHATMQEINSWIRAESVRPFDLLALPLVRWRLFQLEPNRHMLVHIEHHLLHDGWSFALLLRELFAIYEARQSDRPVPLLPVKWHSADVALFERRWIESEAPQRQIAFWKRLLGSVPKVLELPADKPRPPVESFRGDAVRVRLDGKLTARLEAFSREQRATLHMVLRATFEALIHRLTGAEQFLVGSGAANRGSPALESVVGMLINNLALPADVSGDPNLETLLRRVRDTAIAALDNQEIPFDHVVKALDPERSSGHSPLCQVFFSSYDGPIPSFELSNVRVDPFFGLNNGSAKFELNIIVAAIPHALSKREPEVAVPAKSIEMIWEFRTDRFLRDTIERWSAWFVALLDRALNAPLQPLASLPLMSTAELERVLVTWNGTATAYPRDTPIHKLFEEVAERSPQKPAIVSNGQAISYRELDRQANEFAALLRAKGIGAAFRVGLCLRRSVHAIAAMLGTLKAGAVYVPLDPDDPKSRRERLSREVSLDLLVNEGGWEILVDEGAPKVRKSENAAYIMFTSGSTGVPKGVLVTHRSVVRLVRQTDYVTLDSNEVLLQMAPLTFDASTFEVWGALLNGGTLVLWPDREIDLAALEQVLEANSVTTLWLTASLLHAVVDEKVKLLGGLRQLLAGGDVLQPGTIAAVRKEFPRLRIVNGYGPTEATTFSCCYTVPAGPIGEGSVPIGRPIANSTAYVLDERLQPVPIGVPGELFVGGDGVALGYVNAPALNAERFLADPWGDSGSRLYRTGDRVRWRSDGQLEFLGRIDRQVKVRGYRIEPAEVESAIGSLPSIGGVVVTTPNDPIGGHRLHAFVVTDGGADAASLRSQLATVLPRHMIPSGFTFLEQLPLGSTGKIDRKRLIVHEAASLESSKVGVPPNTETERKLAEIWKRVLESTSVSADDGFFDLGGHSLLALQLVHAINSAFGLDLPVRFVIEETTIARQATVIDKLRLYAPKQASQYPPVVAIRAHGSRIPFFLVAGGFGGEAELLVYAKLADYIDPDQPFYGLRIKGVDDLVEPPNSVEAIAAELVAELRKVQPQGPYLIGGSCVGGVVAVEIAQQLSRQGQQIDLLVLVDSRYPSWIWYGRYLTRLALRDLKEGGLAKVFGGSFRDSTGNAAIERKKFRIGLKYLRHTIRYSAKPFAGKITLIVSEGLQRNDPTKGWRALARDGLVMRYVPGDHFTHLRKYVSETGAELDHCLSIASETPASKTEART